MLGEVVADGGRQVVLALGCQQGCAFIRGQGCGNGPSPWVDSPQAPHATHAAHRCAILVQVFGGMAQGIALTHNQQRGGAGLIGEVCQ